jgi:hypothetical protein
MATATGGAVTTYAGSAAGAAASPCGNVDAIGTNARFGAPYGLAVSPLDGSQWVADGTYHRIRRIAPSAAGSFVTQGATEHLAGSLTGAAGFLDGVGSAAAFSSSYALMFDPASATGLAFVAEETKVRTLSLIAALRARSRLLREYRPNLTFFQPARASQNTFLALSRLFDFRPIFSFSIPP